MKDNKKRSVNKNTFFSQKRIKKIIDFENYTMQEKLILSFTALVLLIVVFSILRNNFSKNNNIDYKTQTAEMIYEDAIDVNDRQVYWTLNDIISTYISSYYLELPQTNNKDDITYSREEFYNVLSNDYLKSLNKKEYMKLSKSFCEKFVINDFSMKTSDIIESVREVYDTDLSNMYICKLKTVTNENAYIGIKINPNNSTYNIFYIN